MNKGSSVSRISICRKLRETKDAKDALALKRSVDTALSSFHAPALEFHWPDIWKDLKVSSRRAEVSEERKAYSMLMPPPNVTGKLHLGHALTCTIQDLITRRKRMQGYEVAYIPGVDHAGIATQMLVERANRGKGLSKEALLAEAKKWASECEGEITNQLALLGVCADWDRFYYTLDGPRSEAVREAFVRMHELGYVYRDTRLVNWVPALGTAISDVEVATKEAPVSGPLILSVPGEARPVEFGWLYTLNYPLEDGGFIQVATTRPETLFGDVALAVHPNDSRFNHLIGRRALSIFGGESLPIVGEAELVDPEFGTGALKVTPAHDLADFKIARKHGLDLKVIYNDSGKLNEACGTFAGLPRFEARRRVLADLEARGLLVGKKLIGGTVSVCGRTGDVVEPMLKPQWFVAMSREAEQLSSLVSSGQVQLFPPEEKLKWAAWMREAQDWCVSRQLWWGHRIPAYRIRIGDKFLAKKGEKGLVWLVSRDPPEKTLSDFLASQKNVDTSFTLEVSELHGHSGESLDLAGLSEAVKRGEVRAEADEDVLDTWFSSSLLPLSALGWPQKSDDFKRFFPTDMLETGSDILFFWVARMVFSSWVLTGQVPFRSVFLHKMITDSQGRKMSKTTGNGVDPLSFVGLDFRAAVASGVEGDNEEGARALGADCLRLALLSQLRDSAASFSEAAAATSRRLAVKLFNVWQLLVLRDLETLDFRVPDHGHAASEWIISKLSAVASEANGHLDAHRYHQALRVLSNFFFDDYANLFLEAFKVEPQTLGQTAGFVFFEFLKLLHPFAPFVTEELYAKLPISNKLDSINLERYPCPSPTTISTSQIAPVVEFESAVESITALRGLAPLAKPALFSVKILTKDLTNLQSYSPFIRAASAYEITVESVSSSLPSGAIVLNQNISLLFAPKTVEAMETIQKSFCTLRDQIDLRNAAMANKESKKNDKKQKNKDTLPPQAEQLLERLQLILLSSKSL